MSNENEPLENRAPTVDLRPDPKPPTTLEEVAAANAQLAMQERMDEMRKQQMRDRVIIVAGQVAGGICTRTGLALDDNAEHIANCSVDIAVRILNKIGELR